MDNNSNIKPEQKLKLKLNTIKIVSLEPKVTPKGGTCATCECGGKLGVVADY